MNDSQPIDLFTASPLSPRRRATSFEPHETADLLGFPRRLTTFRDATKRERVTPIRGKSVEPGRDPFTPVATLYVAVVRASLLAFVEALADEVVVEP